MVPVQGTLVISTCDGLAYVHEQILGFKEECAIIEAVGEVIVQQNSEDGGFQT
jgi:hypothetical protein